jgi:hypothetical protein
MPNPAPPTTGYLKALLSRQRMYALRRVLRNPDIPAETKIAKADAYLTSVLDLPHLQAPVEAQEAR